MNPAEIALATVALPVVMATGYLAFLSLLSRRPRPPVRPPPGLRFAVVIPAHDEEAGISSTIESLLAMDYPRELFSLLVVADNCSDATAERARLAGATVLVRDDITRRGKGFALAHAFSRILEENRVDAVVVVDADTVASPGLLHAFVARLEVGADAVQADYRVRNPDDSWRTQLMAVAFATTHTLRSRARERLRLSCGLHGNGMCFSVKLLRAVPYDAFSVVEDLEYGLRLGEAGHRVFHADEAQVLGSMPVGERASRTQRRRWEGGRTRLLMQRAPRLLALGLWKRDPVRLDLAAELLVPPLSTLAAATVLGLMACGALSIWAGGPTEAAWPWAVCAVTLLIHVARGWQISGTGARGLGALAHVPAYLAWKLTLPLRRATHARGEWVRTARDEERP